MPIPIVLLNRYHGAVLTVHMGESVWERPLSGDQALPLGLSPEAWYIGVCDPEGHEGPESRAQALQALGTSARQAGYASLSAQLRGDGLEQEGLLFVGLDRARALRLGYKRAQWAVLGLIGQRVELVYTGLNSRMSQGD